MRPRPSPNARVRETSGMNIDRLLRGSVTAWLLLRLARAHEVQGTNQRREGCALRGTSSMAIESSVEPSAKSETNFHKRQFAPAHSTMRAVGGCRLLAQARNLRVLRRVESALMDSTKAPPPENEVRRPAHSNDRGALASSAEARTYVGISGWRYAPWRGVFYPQGLRQASELHFASRSFSTIELNGSFYSLMRPETYQAWYEETPPGFVFAVKGGRFITHLKRLKEVATPLANFFASGVLRLREKLGPILWQLPPQLVFDEPKLRAFFELLPRSTEQAAALARRHDQRLAGRSEIRALRPGSLRHALEVRHPSFVTPAFVELLREYGVAACVADTAGLFHASTTSPPTSCTCDCTVRASFTRAAMRRVSSANGRHALRPGEGAAAGPMLR